MLIKSAKYESNLGNYHYLLDIIFGSESNAVKYLEKQIKLHGKDSPVDIEEREYFAFLKNMNN